MAQWTGKVNGSASLSADRCSLTVPFRLRCIVLQKREWHRPSSGAWTIETSLEITDNLVINLIVDWILMVAVIWKGNFMKLRFHQHLYKSGLLTKPTCHGYLYCWCLCVFWLYLKTCKSFNSEPCVALVYRPFWRWVNATKAAPKRKCQMLCCSKSTGWRQRGCPFLLIHLKLICATAAFLILPHNSFDLKVEGSKFQEPRTLVMWL